MSETVARIKAGRIIGILRTPDIAESGVGVAPRLIQLGVRSIKLTLDQSASLGVIEELAGSVPADVLVGGGTVTTLTQVRDLAVVGARFIESPHTDPGLITEALRHGMVPIPGALTPTEIARTVDAGAPLVKLSPAGPLGAGYLRALRGPFFRVAFVVTGWIRVADAHDLLSVGAVDVGLGSHLTAPDGPPEELAAVLKGTK